MNQRISAESLLLCPAVERTVQFPVQTDYIKQSNHTLNNINSTARTDEERRFLSVLTRAVDDSGWLEETSKSSHSENKSPLFIEIIL